MLAIEHSCYCCCCRRPVEHHSPQEPTVKLFLNGPLLPPSEGRRSAELVNCNLPNPSPLLLVVDDNE